MDGFQRMGDPQQQSVRVEAQVQRHVPGDGGLRSGQEEVDGGLSGEPGASLKCKMGQFSNCKAKCKDRTQIYIYKKKTLQSYSRL